MSEQELHYHWEWRLQSSPQAMWPLFANTNRVNHDTGLFPIVAVDRLSGERLDNARRRLRYRLPVSFYALDYEEEPFEWVFPYRYGVVRRFKNHFIDSFRVLAEFEPLADGGTHLVYQAWLKPRNWFGRLGAAVFLSQVASRRFDKAVRAYDRTAMAGAEIAFLNHISLAVGGDARLKQIEQQLVAQRMDADLVARLLNLVRTADDLTLSRMRPYALADLWSARRKAVLELFLQATRLGLLDFQWEVLCPMCRGAEDRISTHLSEVHTQAHCSTCNIDFTANFENSIELTFTPNPAIRDVPRIDFCVAGPEVTPHIVAQQLLPARDQRIIMPMLEPGRYRLRAMAVAGSHYFRVTEQGDGRDEIHIVATGDGWPLEETSLTPAPRLKLQNESDDERLFILERTAWSDQATTAAEVIALQRFRDLFAHEALRPGEQIGVGSLTVLFTDLVESTRMYREIGDAPAFGLVMNHFDVLRQVIDEEQGAIVKTIGDAVMAVFRRPVSALRAMVKAQEILQEPPGGVRPLRLKAAIHTGPSIAVTLNERLDYFGTTINVASRLEKFAHGDDLILSTPVHDDPEVRELLNDPASPFTVEPFDEMLKGFDEECFHLWRVSRNQ
jgi:class 3 adenylate cyclase